MNYSIQHGPFFTGNRKLGKLPNPLSLAGERRLVQTSHWPFFNNILFSWTTPPNADVSLGGSSSSSMDTWGNPSNLWIPCKEYQLNIN